MTENEENFRTSQCETPYLYFHHPHLPPVVPHGEPVHPVGGQPLLQLPHPPQLLLVLLRHPGKMDGSTLSQSSISFLHEGAPSKKVGCTSSHFHQKWQYTVVKSACG